MMQRKLLAGIAFVFSTAVAAQDGAHEHGVADLRVALDGSTLLFEFDSPLDNLVGYEHAPATEDQRAALAEAVSRLEGFDALFMLPSAAGCVLKEVQVESPFPVEDEHAHGHDDHDDHEHDDHEHGDHKHGDHNKHDKADGHEHGHAHGPNNERAHTDMYAVYELECERPDALDAVEVRLIDAFPRIRSLRVETATPKGQGSAKLGKANNRLAL